MDLGAMYGVKLDWIVSFVAVARYGGFSAAAKAVYRGQSRISEHVAELERALDVQLFDRTAHPPRLTPEGRALLPQAEEILRRVQNLSAGGAVRFGAYPSAAAWLFPQVVRRLPDRIRLLLVEGPSVDLEAALVRGDIDLAIRPVHPLVADESLTHEILWREPLTAVFPENHPLASCPSVTLAQLAELPLISIGESDGPRQFESHLAFAQKGLSPESTFRTNQPQTLLSLVRHGLGVGVTNELAVTTANLDGVRLIPIHDAGVERQVALFTRRDRPQSPALRKVVEVLQRMNWST
ncbi:LysR family transcriptional regulator [Kribbella sp. VKM Ac-2566]|uniref:LysR family transcriptional regulator n=1 Tax=Kribbella sp. VKM Ac-2566 TaxID=2512218 RepID=UPI001062DFE7|nr:LysR family transcriptional regulator [Kribbella sp. VKM Ac-2566]TDW83236.1 DNA-binding transcriptional LysR family regulator [Kribbella sp. VKM Ac-2566]